MSNPETAKPFPDLFFKIKKQKKKKTGRSKPRVWTCRRTLRLRAWGREPALDSTPLPLARHSCPRDQQPPCQIMAARLHRAPGPAEGQTHLTSPGLQENLQPRATPSSSLELLASDRASLGARLANADICARDPSWLPQIPWASSLATTAADGPWARKATQPHRGYIHQGLAGAFRFPSAQASTVTWL